MLRFIMKSIYRFFHFNKLRHYEQVCLNAWRSNLSFEDKKKLDHQLKHFDLIQRQARKMKSVFYCIGDPQYENWDDDILFSDRREKKVMSGTLSAQISDVTVQLTFFIYIFEGRLSSIEFSSEPGILATMPTGITVSNIEITEMAPSK